MSDQKVRPFANGTQYMDWLEANCRQCRKYNKNCCLEFELAMASGTDGLIEPEIAKRIGLPSDEIIWRCPEMEVAS